MAYSTHPSDHTEYPGLSDHTLSSRGFYALPSVFVVMCSLVGT